MSTDTPTAQQLNDANQLVENTIMVFCVAHGTGPDAELVKKNLDHVVRVARAAGQVEEAANQNQKFDAWQAMYDRTLERCRDAQNLTKEAIDAQELAEKQLADARAECARLRDIVRASGLCETQTNIR